MAYAPVVQHYGVPIALYTDRARCAAYTPTAGGPPKQPGRRTCAGLHALVRRHLSGQHSVWYGARCLRRYDRNGRPVAA